MSIYLRGGVYWAHFQYKGVRVQKSTGQIDRDAALAVERQWKDELRQRAHGVAIAAKPESPTFQEWAEVYFAEATKKVTRADRIEHLVRGVLRFFGRRPSQAADVYPDAPYHDLRLSDLIENPAWLSRWDAWLNDPKRDRTDPTGKRQRRWSGQTKNQHRSTLSQLYALALKPAWRQTTGIESNPCLGVDRDPKRRRTAVLDREDLLAILSQASYHLRLAIAIALLTPKLREGDILRLRFDRHFSSNFAWLTVHGHKTEAKTGKPLVAYVPEQLREILIEAKRRAGKRQAHVITYQGESVSQLRGAVRGAVERAAAARPRLRYGRSADDGITFHTLRHSASTLLGELDVPLERHRQMMGHERIETTLWYTHLRPVHEQAPAEALSARLPIKDLVLVARKRPPVAETVSSRRPSPAKTGAKRAVARHEARRRKSG